MMYSPGKQTSFDLDFDGPTTLHKVLDILHVPHKEAQIIIVNHNLVEKQDITLENEDEVYIYPVLAGG